MVAAFDFSDLYIEGRNGHLFLLRQDTGAVFGFSIFTGYCSYATEWHPRIENGRLIHFSTPYCKKPVYLFEAEKLHLMCRYNIRPGSSLKVLSLKDRILYQWKLRYYWFQTLHFLRRVRNKLLRIAKQIF